MQAQQKNNQMLSHSKEKMMNLQQKAFPDRESFVPKLKMNTYNPKAIVWRCDTITAFDSLDSKVVRRISNYSINGNLLVEYTQKWNANTWIDDSRYTPTYDPNGYIISGLNENWSNNSWINNYKRSFTNDANGNMLTYLFEEWSNNSWMNYGKHTYTYNSNGNMLTELQESWNNNTWTNSSKSTYTYTINGNLLTQISENWTNNAWVNNGKNTYSYNSNNKILSIIHENWQNAWVNNFKYDLTYDVNGFENQWISLNWNNNTWINNYKYSYINDIYGNSISGKYEIWENNNWHQRITMFLFGNNISIANIDILDLVLYRYTATYKSFTNGITENKDNVQLSIYPNPATNNLCINLQQLNDLQNTSVTVFDMQGKLLLQQTITQQQTELNINQFAKGIYVVKVQNEKEIMQSKFIKE
jgi:hypothetical protein